MPIDWPERDAPQATAVHVRNEIAVAASPQAIWAVLVRAADWPRWYPNAKDVRITGGDSDLTADAQFTWTTFGVAVSSTVREFVPAARLAWDAHGTLFDAYHAWLVEPRGTGAWVLTEENQNGLAARAQALVMPKRMWKGHQLWLERLKAEAERG